MHCYKSRKHRSMEIRVSGQKYQTLEQAVKAFFRDGNVNLPSAPDGMYEFTEQVSPDNLRNFTNASFDRLDAAAMTQNYIPDPIEPNPNPVPDSPSPEPAD